MKISGIYKIESKIKPNRIYIGSAVCIQERWWSHYKDLRKNKHHSQKLQRHYNKYGEADLLFSVILGCEKEDLIKNEQFFIDSYKPYFNNRPNAGNQLGFKHSEETKRKFSILKKGQVSANKGKKATPELIKKLSDAHLGQKSWNKGLKGIYTTSKKGKHYGFVPWNKGKKNVYSESTLQEMSDAKAGHIPWNKGKKLPPHSEEQKKKISESGKKAWERRLKVV